MSQPNGILSKGIKLYYGTGSGSVTYTQIEGLQEVPDLGASSPEKVEVTDLSDSTRRYIKGISDPAGGDLTFTFLYDNSDATSNYRVLKGLETAGNAVPWKVELPDAPTSGTGTHHGTEITFTGECVVAIKGQAVNSAIQFTLTIIPNSAMSVANPA